MENPTPVTGVDVEVKTRKARTVVAKPEKVYPAPLVTEANKTVRKINPGFKNPNKGIEVSPGLTMQDVPREIIIQHMRQSEQFWKVKFNQQYGGSYGGQQSFAGG